MKKPVTIIDIAKKLHMSPSTVSKALNDDTSISVMTKERVKQLAAEWNYIPNEAARHFKQSKTFTIGVIIPDLMDEFYVLAINGVEEVADKNKYHVIIYQSHENAQKEEEQLKKLISSRVDGIIMAISRNTKRGQIFDLIRDAGIPVVHLSRSFSKGDDDIITTDTQKGARLAVDLFYKRGHRRIAHLMGPATFHTSHHRLDSYREALLLKGLPYDEKLVRQVNLTSKDTYAAMRSLLNLRHPPTAFFMYKSYLALDALLYLQKYKPTLIDQLDIIGFGNLNITTYLNHKPLASIDENAYASGAVAASRLIERIHSRKDNVIIPSAIIKVSCSLVIHKK